MDTPNRLVLRNLIQKHVNVTRAWATQLEEQLDDEERTTILEADLADMGNLADWFVRNELAKAQQRRADAARAEAEAELAKAKTKAKPEANPEPEPIGDVTNPEP